MMFVERAVVVDLNVESGVQIGFESDLVWVR